MPPPRDPVGDASHPRAGGDGAEPASGTTGEPRRTQRARSVCFACFFAPLATFAVSSSVSVQVSLLNAADGLEMPPTKTHRRAGPARRERRYPGLPALELTPGEAQVALRALRRAVDIPAFPFTAEAASALRKLTFDLVPAGTSPSGTYRSDGQLCSWHGTILIQADSGAFHGARG